ncbi:CHAP domain-containing protein [Granulicoccus phenolivorans]|uniref:CHAP domain-containing protein n=1 Tax=Granulicoccus phenolivorans TaxID=266854 RepID=UPI0006847E5B|nr:CHAP domain-containing protein [Granulicoccus phenolivorans]
MAPDEPTRADAPPPRPAGPSRIGGSGDPGRGTPHRPVPAPPVPAPPDSADRRAVSGAGTLPAPAGAGSGDPASPGAAAGGAARAATAARAVQALDGAAANAAGNLTQRAVRGDGSSAARDTAARYAGGAVSGAIAGARAGAAAGGVGALPGAAAGAAKNVALEGAQDAVRGVAAVTGGGPDATPAEPAGAGGTGPATSPLAAHRPTSTRPAPREARPEARTGGPKAGHLVLAAGAAATPGALAVILAMAFLQWLKAMFFAAMAMLANGAAALWGFLTTTLKGAAGAVSAPFASVGGLATKTAGALGFTVGAAAAPAVAVGAGVVTSVAALTLVTALVAGALTTTVHTDGRLRTRPDACRVAPRPVGANAGTFTGQGVPAAAIPWIENAAARSAYRIPAAFFAFIMDRESDFRPDLFANDSNGGTWGLFQINAAEWRRFTGGGTVTSPDITDPMIHTTHAAQYFDDRLETVRRMRQNNPDAAYTTQLTDLEALLIAHNAGEGNLQRYPNLPSITTGYLAEFRQKFPTYGGGEPSRTRGEPAPAAGPSTAAPGPAGPSETAGPTPPAGGRSYPNLGLQPNANALAHLLGTHYGITTIGGLRGDGEHTRGYAMDLMVPLTADGKATGQAIADYLVRNADAVGISNVIWYQQIWTTQRRSEGWRAMEDRGSPTENHRDHVHVLLTDEAPVLTALPGQPGSAVDSANAAAGEVRSDCAATPAKPGGTAPGTLTGGGLTEPDAQALITRYIEEGDRVLRARFQGGGPGQCNGSYTANCVSFSWYFVTAYTSFTGGYAPGNGVDVAGAMAGVMHKQTTRTPTPYAVFSHGHTSNPSVGHTGVVLAVDGTRILIGEASYCEYAGRVRWVEAATWQTQNWEFVDVSDLVGQRGQLPHAA